MRRYYIHEKSVGLINRSLEVLDIAQDYKMDEEMYTELSRAIYILEQIIKHSHQLEDAR